jgi:hypothetical protein
MKPNSTWSRRRFLKTASSSALAMPALASGFAHAAQSTDASVEIGSRRELFLDDFLIDRLSGATLKLQIPEPGDVVFVCDAPWEGRHSNYFSLFKDGGNFRAYYRGWDYTQKRQPYACCAQSEDGIRWTRPEYGVVEFEGSTANNIVMAGPNEMATHNLTPFKDSNPACDPASRYKAFGRHMTGDMQTGRISYLDAFRSADGLKWERIGDKPVTGRGAFDSQNVAFWDPGTGLYRAYWRPFVKKGGRSVATAVSSDFVNWRDETLLVYEHDTSKQQLYTCNVEPYARAPHLFLGFPTRFLPDKSVAVNKKSRASSGTTEPIFMSSRDGMKFRRWADAIIPQNAPKDRMGNRSNYTAYGLLQLPGRDREISLYATEAGYNFGPTRLRRFIYRSDGFVAVNAPAAGELLTRPLRFTGRSLEINARTTAGGSVRVELCDASGRALPGFEASQCAALSGDEIAWNVRWKGDPDLSAHAGKPVRLRFVLAGADLFAMKFNA